MNVMECLDELKKLAIRDPELRAKLIATRESKAPVSDFCKVALEAGIYIDMMDLVCAEDEAYTAMARSTNGGGENSPRLLGEADYHELFLMELEAYK
ncbi:MAG: hypothetical protein K6C99_01965 [Lachnospiraceae bacterium]|nr:hypothetical protein [Lachnospiraceae bacterium]